MGDVEKMIAALPGVRAAVRDTRDDLAAGARADFSAHDRPGGHRIYTEDQRLNFLYGLEGPAPGALEYGHFARDGRTFVPGIHVLGRSVR